MYNCLLKILVFLSCLVIFDNPLLSDYQIVNVEKLNTINDDFAPAYHSPEKTLYYNWSNENKSQLLKRKIDINDKITFNNINDIFFDKPIGVDDNITKFDINPVYICFWDKEAYFTGKSKTKKGSILSVYKSNYEKNNWQITRLLDEFGTNHFTFHPTISPSGNVLVYCSASLSNPEDSDLMIAYRDEKNNWSTSVPLNNLNSNFSEITPFFASDDTLYFASNGLDGRGGYDIYYSIFENGNWQKPIPMQDVNTEYDESDFAKINSDLFLFVSNRPGGKGGLDIWAYFRNTDDTPDKEPIFRTSLNSTTLRIIQHSSYIQLLNNNQIGELPIKTRMTQDNNYYYLYVDSIISNPSHLQINCQVDNLNDNQFYQLTIKANKQQLISQKINQKDTSFLLPIQKIIEDNNIPDYIEINSIFKIFDWEEAEINKVEIYKSHKESVEVFEIDNIRYRLIVIPLPKQVKDEELEKSLKFLKQEAKYKNGKIIVESSPSFELYDSEKIKSFLNTLNINNNAIIYQSKANKNLTKYFNNLNFNYLLIYLQI